MVSEYPGRLALFHIDLYRVEGAAEAAGLGLEEYLWGQGVAVIEWAERILEELPEERLEVGLEITGDTTRRVELSGLGDRLGAVAKRLCERFGAATG